MYEAEIANSLHSGIRNLIHALGVVCAFGAAVAVAIGILSLLGMPLFGHSIALSRIASRMPIALARPEPVRAVAIPSPRQSEPAVAPEPFVTDRESAVPAQPERPAEAAKPVNASTSPQAAAPVTPTVLPPAAAAEAHDAPYTLAAVARIETPVGPMLPAIPLPASAPAIPTMVALASADADLIADSTSTPIPLPSGRDSVLTKISIPMPLAAPPRPPLPPTPTERLHLDKSARAKAEKCIAQAVYFEAGDQPYRGQVAVAQVIMNRVFSPYYPDDVCAVVYQNAGHHLACQFTFACDGKPERVTDWAEWRRAKRIAKDTLDGKIWVEQVGKSTHYHADYVHPVWVREMKRTFRTGEHIFYRPLKWGDGSDEANWSLVAQHVALPARGR